MSSYKEQAAIVTRQSDARDDRKEATLENHDSLATIRHADDVLLAKLGYKSEFKRKISVRPDTSFRSMQQICFLTCYPFS